MRSLIFCRERDNMEKIAPEDAVIIARIRRNEKGAFDELVQRHQQRAYCYAHRLTNDQEEAADIVADSFVRVFRSLDSFKGDSSFTTWLYRIETNCFLDMRKKAKIRPSVSLDDVVLGADTQVHAQIIDESESAHEHVEKAERLSVIMSAIKRLPRHQQTILMMYHAESMSYDSIAEALSLPIGTVKSRLNRARLSLQSVLHPRRNLFVLPNRRQRAVAVS